ncbi:hypothetical protein TanjilG_20839 [Lupinus angustifolius]|uniref:Ribosomal RNA-processing protein 17 n=1 Tax=Lupinus angustifolius TaxID=3871 RepID=A0A4P1QRZ4_LUPAN|nr:PREDICTED: ribosomal RNA-processing protein 17 [Lupinus angustifolius]XP_019422475.1 PREDICTED: ribosomal RNA-processing protein 17 [Lupinus angustifolius]OIV93177.1 hypothetical protein TanjilG_20839 [Lupinus angustifolius]
MVIGIGIGGDVEEPKAARQHRKKRALKNKGLSVTFNEKDLNDYVTGFHKRKKKRRKEAQKQQEDALRRKRTEQRKKRKLERELVQGGGVIPTADEPENDEAEAVVESIAETKTYENADLKVTVVTSEISPEEESYPNERKEPTLPIQPVVADKKQVVPINNRKPFKKAVKHWSRPKPASKRDKKKGNKRGKK